MHPIVYHLKNRTSREYKTGFHPSITLDNNNQTVGCVQSVERRAGSQDIKESSEGGLGYEAEAL